MLNGNRVIAIRARARRGWPIKKIARAFGVSRNTVRRYARQQSWAVIQTKHPGPAGQFELELVQRVARRWRTTDQSELESALTLHVASLYRKRNTVTDWKAFLITALNAKANNWLRDRQRHHRDLVSIDQVALEGNEQPAPPDITDTNTDDQFLIDRLRRKLPPALSRVLDALVAENYDQTRAAIRLGVHRNTIRNALRRIRVIAKNLAN